MRKRIASLINRKRTVVTPEEKEAYFKELEQALKDVPPSNVFNYDETNFANNTGREKLLFRRGLYSLFYV